MECSVCKSYRDLMPNLILNKSRFPNELSKELNMYYNHFTNMNNKFNEYDETACYQNKNLLDFYFDEGSYAQKINLMNLK